MSKFWIRFWWIFTAVCLLGMLVVWLLPEPVRDGDALQPERKAVAAQVQAVQGEFPDIRIDDIKAHGNHVVELHATWIGAHPPKASDRQAWEQLADQFALAIAKNHLPDGWQINVALWYKHLPRGVVGRTAGDNPQGGPARLFRDRSATIGRTAN